jgi:hypothetical protein
VVQDVDADDFAGGDHVARAGDVLGRWRRVPGRVVVLCEAASYVKTPLRGEVWRLTLNGQERRDRQLAAPPYFT